MPRLIMKFESIFPNPRRSSQLLSVAIVAACIGCGGKPASVTGVVTLDGKPLQRGAVGFTPASGGTRATGVIESDGSYTLVTNRDSGLEVGEYAATVASREAGPEPTGGGPPMPGPWITPQRYAVEATSGLKYTVNKGANVINIELTSQRAK